MNVSADFNISQRQRAVGICFQSTSAIKTHNSIAQDNLALDDIKGCDP
jgi:hypothetical protein